MCLDIICDFRWQKERVLRVFLCTCNAEGAIALSAWLSGDVLYCTRCNEPYTVLHQELYFTGTEVHHILQTVHQVLYCTRYFKAPYTVLQKVLYCTEYCNRYCIAGIIMHHILYCTKYYTALCNVLRQVLYCNRYFNAPNTVLHHVLYSARYCTALGTVFYLALQIELRK